MAARNPNGVSAVSTAAGPLTNVTIVLDEEEKGLNKHEIWNLVTREARAVSVWALIAPLIRLLLEPLISLACVETDGETCPSSSNISALAGWLLSVFPRAVAKNLAPGFVFASAWCVVVVCVH